MLCLTFEQECCILKLVIMLEKKPSIRASLRINIYSIID